MTPLLRATLIWPPVGAALWALHLWSTSGMAHPRNHGARCAP